MRHALCRREPAWLWSKLPLYLGPHLVRGLSTWASWRLLAAADAQLQNQRNIYGRMLDETDLKLWHGPERDVICHVTQRHYPEKLVAVAACHTRVLALCPIRQPHLLSGQ